MLFLAVMKDFFVLPGTKSGLSWELPIKSYIFIEIVISWPVHQSRHKMYLSMNESLRTRESASPVPFSPHPRINFILDLDNQEIEKFCLSYNSNCKQVLKELRP